MASYRRSTLAWFAKEVMRSSRLTRWTLMASLAACSSNPPPPESGQEGTYGAGSTGASAGAAGSSSGTGTTNTGGIGTSTGAGTNTTATGTSSSTGAGSTSTGAGGNGTGASGSGKAGSGSDGDDGIGGGAGGSGATDASAPDSPGIVGVNDAGRGNGGCTNDRVSLGSIRLMAGGTTPPAFADAYNAELMALTTGGPLLIALTAVGSSAAARRADLGALAESGQGVTFAGGHATVPFSTDALGAIRIALTEAPFELKFVPPATNVLLPIAAVALDSALTTGCGALAVTAMKLVVPASAGSIAFHGGTVAALMGAPTEGYGGGTANAWPLELSGVAQRVFAPGASTDEGGIGP